MTCVIKSIPLLLLLTLAACQPAPDPKVAAAAQAAAVEKAAEEGAQQFEAEVARQNWDLARAHGDVLLAKYPGSAAAERIKPKYADVRAKADAAREQRRLQMLWAYQTEKTPKGDQLSAAIYAKSTIDVDGSGAKPVRLIFRDHPEWGRSAYLTLEAGDFDCYRGCKLKVIVDDGKPRTLPGSRPKTDEAIAMFIEDEKTLWRLCKEAKKSISIEFPVKAGGTRTALFEVGELDSSRLPKW